jgi:non-heme chloroperoxidase
LELCCQDVCRGVSHLSCNVHPGAGTKVQGGLGEDAGLTISAQDWGNPNGPEILFIHGFSQSHLSWIKQVTNSDLAKEFHVVTYDLRGHGNSDKPFEPERYKTSKYWGDEVQAVMDATGLKRPVLVGWSYGGRVMADYLTTHGTAKLAGLNYVDAGQKGDPSSSVRICAISP